jgi:hypothetical protein
VRKQNLRLELRSCRKLHDHGDPVPNKLTSVTQSPQPMCSLFRSARGSEKKETDIEVHVCSEHSETKKQECPRTHNHI